MGDDYVSKSEVSRRRGVSRRAVYRMMRKNALPVDKQGRIPRAEFEYMEARLTGAAEDLAGNTVQTTAAPDKRDR